MFEVRPEQKPVIADFFRNIDELKYPQPLVCETLICSESDLNIWRSRDLVPTAYWSKNGRVTFNGRGLIFVGFFRKLNWVLGPKRTSETAEVLMEYVEHVEHMVLDEDDFSFINDVLTFSEPIAARGEANRPRLWYSNQKRRDLKDGLGLPLDITPMEELQKHPVGRYPTVSMSLGEHIARWCSGIRERLELR